MDANHCKLDHRLDLVIGTCRDDLGVEWEWNEWILHRNCVIFLPFIGVSKSSVNNSLIKS